MVRKVVIVLATAAMMVGMAVSPAEAARPAVCKNVTGKVAVKLCVKLARKPAYSVRYQGARVKTPKGKALVRECRADYGNHGSELRSCFRGWLKDYSAAKRSKSFRRH
jgi:hypothetical protein